MKKTKKLTVSSLMVATGVVILYFASLFSALDLSISLLASLIILIVQIELGIKYSLSVYAATSLISLLILPQKYIALMYLFFCGIYPIIRVYITRLGKIFAPIIKLLYFGGALTVVVLASKFLFTAEVYEGYMLLFFYIVCFVAFILCDMLIGKLALLYNIRLRKLLHIDRLFR